MIVFVREIASVSIGRLEAPITKYFLEIRNILNGYVDRHNNHADEIYIDDFNRIKGLISSNDSGWGYYFEWFNNRKVKKAVKSLPGEPFDVLRRLARHGYIEQAVRLKIKLSTRK